MPSLSAVHTLQQVRYPRHMRILSISMKMSLSEIPTLSALYKTKVLMPAATSAYSPEQTLNQKVSHIRYDLTKLHVDAIVNAANTSLLGGGGVDGAIHRAAGNGLYRECRQLNGCATGSAKSTDAYNLPCKKVIHAVGPVYHGREKSEPLLRGCYRKSVDLAVQNGCKSIAFSALSTGVYGYPSPEAAEAAISEVRSFLTGSDGEKIERVVFCSFEMKDVKAYIEALP